jgi:cytochrome c oxidase assembly protein Cox11
MNTGYHFDHISVSSTVHLSSCIKSGHLRIFRKPLKKIQVSFKSDMNSVYHFDHISVSSTVHLSSCINSGHLRIFRKPLKKIQVSFKSNMNTGYHFDHISVSSSQNVKCSDQSSAEHRTSILSSVTFFENCAFMR